MRKRGRKLQGEGVLLAQVWRQGKRGVSLFQSHGLSFECGSLDTAAWPVGVSSGWQPGRRHLCWAWHGVWAQPEFAA